VLSVVIRACQMGTSGVTATATAAQATPKTSGGVLCMAAAAQMAASLRVKLAVHVVVESHLEVIQSPLSAWTITRHVVPF
jgi:hypothetical protein